MTTLIPKYDQGATGAVNRPFNQKLAETVSVKDFGAIGTAVPANEATDTAAFLAAMATGKNVYVPEGTYYVSETINIGYGQKLSGAGEAATVINSSNDTCGIYMGAPGLISLIYNCELGNLTLACSSRSTTLYGVMLENCVYFNVENLQIFGSGNPNSAVPAERDLYGSGIYLTNNTIIGRINHVSTRVWNYGYYLRTLPSSQSAWTAAIEISGQGEAANCNRGIVIGEVGNSFYSGVGVSIRNMTFQGNYVTGINVWSGINTIIDGCYFEANANYDVFVGVFNGINPQPQMVTIINNTMESSDQAPTPYGTFPYLAKIAIDNGVFTTVRDNNLSINTAIPLIIISHGDFANITGNRLNSTIATTGRILDNGDGTITHDNYPEAATVGISSITRALDAASGDEVYTGLGFQPTSIEFNAYVNTAVEQSIGFCGLTNVGYKNRCVTSDAANAKTGSTNCIKIIKPTAADISSAVLKSFDKDGFTLTWTKTGAPSAVNLSVEFIARRS